MANVVLPRIGGTEQTEESNPLKHLHHLYRNRKGANVPPPASRLTRERFTIFIGENERSLPDLAVSGVAQQSSLEEVKLEEVRDSVIHALEYDVRSRGNFEAQGSNTSVSLSMLKIKGLAALNPIKTVKELFARNEATPSHATFSDLNPDDVVWEDFNNSEKLKDNLDVLLQCKKMNINFEVARGRNLPGILVVPKFHCRRCYHTWLDGNEAPNNCDQPSDPVRGALIALDERAKVFLKDRDVSFIEIRGQCQSIYQSSGHRRPTFDFLREKGSIQHVRHNSFVDNLGTDEEEKEEAVKMDKEETTSFSNAEPRMSVHYKLKKSATNQDGSSLKNTTSEECASSGAAKSSKQKQNLISTNEKRVGHVVADPNDAGDGIRKYGGMTNSQARVFVNRSLLDAEARRSISSSESRLRVKLSNVKRASSMNVTQHTKGVKQKQNTSRESAISTKTPRKGKRNKQKGNNNSQIQGASSKSVTVVTSATASSALDADEKESVEGTSDELPLNPDDTAEKKDTNLNGEGTNGPTMREETQKEKAKKPGETHRTSIAQSIMLEINPEDTANDILAKVKKRTTVLKTKDNKESRRVSNVGATSDERRTSIQVRKDEKYLIEGGNLLSKQSLNERRVSVSKDGLGYKRSSVTYGKNNEPGSQDVSNNSRLQLKVRRGSFSNKRGSLSQGETKPSKDEKPDYELPPVELSKSAAQAPGSAEILELHSKTGINENLNFRDNSGSEITGSQGNMSYNSMITPPSDVQKYVGVNRAFNLAKKHNIFGNFYQGRKKATPVDGDDSTCLSRATLTPSPVLQHHFPKSDLIAMKMVNLTQSFTFSFYEIPIQYKKHNESVRNRINGVGGGKKGPGGGKKSNKSKKK